MIIFITIMSKRKKNPENMVFRCTKFKTTCRNLIIVVVGLDAKMEIVYGWYRAGNEESSDKSK